MSSRWIDRALPCAVVLASTLSACATPTGGESLANLPASFTGDLPCADCTALRHHLALFPDRRYDLRRVYVGKSDEPFDEAGRWSSANGRIELQRKQGRMLLEIRNQNVLRLLDQQGKPIATQLNYDLTRTPAFEPLSDAKHDAPPLDDAAVTLAVLEERLMP